MTANSNCDTVFRDGHVAQIASVLFSVFLLGNPREANGRIYVFPQSEVDEVAPIPQGSPSSTVGSKAGFVGATGFQYNST